MRFTYIDDPAKRPDGVCTVYILLPTAPATGALNILHHTARNHNDILCSARQFLDCQVDHLPQARIAVLEQLGDAEEQLGSFSFREALTGVTKVYDLGQEDSAFAG
jgi:hypothetical protein